MCHNRAIDSPLEAMMAISRRRFLKAGAAMAAGLAAPFWQMPVEAADTPLAEGPFAPTWDSLAQYQTPDWFRDAKFGIWAHWGPQCQPGQGDWYARQMYQQGSHDYDYQCVTYGHPSKAGFKDVIHQWKAESWDPDHLIGLYKRAGAKYFMCLANHHDNFDNFASSYQSWNSVALGPKRDLVGGWEKAARAAGLRFAVSVHAAHAWSWYETSQGADTTGPMAGVPYDGHLTKADGKGQWWEGLDPQELYAQAHAPMGLEWDWNNNGHGDLPSPAYIDKFYKRTLELIDKYHPDQVYFDDTVLPLYPISDVGLRIAAHLYNTNMKRHKGRLEAVLNGKVLNEQQRKCMVMDLERGVSDRIEPLPWQTDTCIGNWHYDINLYHQHGYKTVDQVVHMLVDIVSKNGNLMLNIPLPGSGMPDPDEQAFLAGLTQWMDVNSEGIYGTRPWQMAVEGPSGSGTATHAQGFNERDQRYTSRDFRFMQKGDILYAFALAWPADGKLVVRSLAQGAGRVQDVRLLGFSGKLVWTQTPDGLSVTLPSQKPCDHAYGLRIMGKGLTPVLVAPVLVVEQPRADGTLTLAPSDADLHGSIQIQTIAGVENIGYWDDRHDTVSWQVHFPASGSYNIAAMVSAAVGATAFILDAGPGASATIQVPDTGGWDRFQTVTGGPLTVAAPGDFTVTVRCADPAAWHAMNLGAVTLTRT